MTNASGNKANNGINCAFCGKPVNGYLQWLCKKHRTKECAAVANARLAEKSRSGAL